MKFFVFSLVISFSVSVIATDEKFSYLAPDFKPGFTPIISETEGGLWMIMSEVEENINNSPSRLNDSNLNNYLKSVVCKLSKEYCKDIRLYIIRKPDFNASMAANGMMQVLTGLLLRMRNEAQLATVLGHEIGHYLKRHSLKKFNDSKMKSTFATFLTLGIAGGVSAGAVNADVSRTVIDVTNLVLVASIFSHSRESEKEADKYGIQLLNDAKLDINEAPKIWKNLIEENKAGDNDISSGIVFFSTHPDPGKRVLTLENHVQGINEFESTYTETNQDEYWKHIAPYMDILIQDELNLRQFDQTEFLLNHLINDKVQLGTTHYYLGELYRLRKNDGDDNRSLYNYKKAIEFENYPTEAHRSLGLIHYKEKKFDLAKEHFEKYLELNPEANDKEMIEFYINFGA